MNANVAVNSDFLEEVSADIKACVSKIGYDLESKYPHLFKDRITHKTEIKPIRPVIEIAGVPFAVEDDFSVVGGLPKSGKTSVAVYMIATAFMQSVADKDTLSIRTKYSSGRPVFYFDTEQPKAYTDKLRKQVLKILGLDEEPPNLFIINLRESSIEGKQKKIFEWMDLYPDAILWIIDGLADLIKDPNDTKESFGIIEELTIRSSQKHTTIVGFIHENPGASGKLRGNLGSQAERKCGGAITIKKHKDLQCHSIEPRLIRGGPDFDPIYFRYDKEFSGLRTVDATETKEISGKLDKRHVKLSKLISLAQRILSNGRAKYTELVNSILTFAPDVEGASIGKRTAEKRVKTLLDNGIIALENGFYTLADKYVSKP